MGWTSYNATYYKSVSGHTTVDRKAECDSICNDSCNTVLKSAMVGKVYYAAVKRTARYDWSAEKPIPIPLPDNEQIVYAVIFVTSVDMKDYNNFSYKDMDETVLPYYYDCPASILRLLTSTDCERAKQWRAKCWEHIEKRKERKTLSALPIGTVISYSLGQGRGEVRLQKTAPSYQFKRPFWKVVGEQRYMKSKLIPDDFTIVA